MNDYQNPEITTPAQPPKGEAIKSMIFGILSIYIGWFMGIGIVGIIFAQLAKKWSLPIIEEYPGTSAAKFAKVGNITGKVGFWVSLATLAILALAIVIYVLYIVLYVFLLGMIMGAF